LATWTLREDSVAQPHTSRRTAVAIAVMRHRDMTPLTFLDAMIVQIEGARLAQTELHTHSPILDVCAVRVQARMARIACSYQGMLRSEHWL
jgi:D-aminopeptidase